MQTEFTLGPEWIGPAAPGQTGPNRHFDQFWTPEWAANLIVRKKFGDLTRSDRVVDAGTGRGAFLKAIPSYVPALGVEIDAALAAFAADDTGREVLVGDFRTIPLPYQPTVIVGNPPFSREIAEAFLARSAQLLGDGGRCGFLLPSSFLSFSSTLSRWREHFSIRHELLPRDVFPRISVPLSFYTFTRERGVRRLHGFLLFEECHAVGGAPKPVKLALVRGARRQSVWRVAVEEAMRALGGRATLRELYSFMAGRLPVAIRFWRDTVRRVLQEGGFVNLDRGVWAIAT